MRTHGRRQRKQEWDDAQLVEAAVGGDSVAADVLFARYDRYAWKVAIHYTHTHHAAEEAVAAGRASAFEKMSQLRDPSRFGPWLAAMVKNAAYSEHRRSSRMVPSDDLADMAFLEDDGEAETTDAERFDRARKALLSLPERHRQAIDMAVFNELPVKEVAAALMIDVNTAYQLLFRARKNLRRAYISTRPHTGATAACRACAAKTLDYLRGNVDVRREVDAHVATCLGCRMHLAEALDDAREMQPLFGLAPVGLVVAWRELARRHPRLRLRPRIRHAAVGSPVAASACAIAAVAVVAAAATGYAVSGHGTTTLIDNAAAHAGGGANATGQSRGPAVGGSNSSAANPGTSSASTSTAAASPLATSTTSPVNASSTVTATTDQPGAFTSSSTSSSVPTASTSSSSTTTVPAPAASSAGLLPSTTTSPFATTSPATTAPATTSPATTSPATTAPAGAPPGTVANGWRAPSNPGANAHPGQNQSLTVPTTAPPTTAPPTAAPPTAAPPTTGPPATTTTTVPPATTSTSTTSTLPPPSRPEGVLLTGNGTTADSGTVGADASWVPGIPTSGTGYAAGPIPGTQAFAFDGSNGLIDAGIPKLKGSNFIVSFDLNTTQATGTTAVNLLGYRTSCNIGNFFDVRLQSPTGDPGGAADGPDHLLVELAQPGGSPVNLRSPSLPTGRLNTGTWRRIEIVRNGTTVKLLVDGLQVDAGTVPVRASYDNDGAWQVANGDVCNGSAGDGTQPLKGEMANILVAPLPTIPVG